jgi:hypothetical protein
MPSSFQRGACAAIRCRKLSQLRCDADVHPSSARAGSRGSTMYIAEPMLCTVSLQRGPSTPRICCSGTPFMYVAGSHSYAVRSSINAAQVSPSSVFLSYFMSRYVLVAGDITTLAPCCTAGGTVSLFHCWAMLVGRSRAFPISSHPTIVLPCLYTMSCTRSTNLMYCGSLRMCTSSPPMWKYGPGVIAAISRTMSSTNAYAFSLSGQNVVHPTSVPVYSPGNGARAALGGIGRLQLNSGYAAIAALVWPGMSISGTTVM